MDPQENPKQFPKHPLEEAICPFRVKMADVKEMTLGLTAEDVVQLINSLEHPVAEWSQLTNGVIKVLEGAQKLEEVAKKKVAELVAENEKLQTTITVVGGGLRELSADIVLADPPVIDGLEVKKRVADMYDVLSTNFPLSFPKH